MAPAVVDGFEAVEIHHQHRMRALLGDQRLQVPMHRALVGQPCEVIVVGHIAQRRFEPGALGDVFAHAVHALHLAVDRDGDDGDVEIHHRARAVVHRSLVLHRLAQHHSRVLLRGVRALLWHDVGQEGTAQQFVCAIAHHALGGGIDGHESSFEVEGEHRIDVVVEQGPVALLADLQTVLDLLARADVTGDAERAHDRAALLDRNREHFELDRRTVDVDQRGLEAFDRAPQHTGEARMHGVPLVLGDQFEVAHAGELFGGIAQHRAHGGTDLEDPTARVDEVVQIGAVLEQRLEP